MRMKIIIIEDQPAEAQHLKMLLQQWGNQTNHTLSIATYGSGEEFYKKRDASVVPAAYFLDIQLGGMNGISVARRLRKEGYKGALIFLTAFREYVFRGYEVHAMNYLLKPVRREQLFHCLDEIAQSLTDEAYCYQTRQELIRIPYREILTFSSSRHYVDITTSTETFSQYATLEKIEEKLPQEFIRVHRSYIVNLAHVYKISGGTITLSNRMTVPVGRSYAQQVTEAMTRYSTRFECV